MPKWEPLIRSIRKAQNLDKSIQDKDLLTKVRKSLCKKDVKNFQKIIDKKNIMGYNKLSEGDFLTRNDYIAINRLL
jgi:hypothetical protein